MSDNIILKDLVFVSVTIFEYAMKSSLINTTFGYYKLDILGQVWRIGHDLLWALTYWVKIENCSRVNPCSYGTMYLLHVTATTTLIITNFCSWTNDLMKIIRGSANGTTSTVAHEMVDQHMLLSILCSRYVIRLHNNSILRH